MFSASFTIPAQLDATPDPICATGGLLCPVVAEKQPGIASPAWPIYKGIQITLGVPLKSPVLTANGWSENGAEPGTDINGQWSQWVMETDWLYLICETAKPAVIGACRWTAVVLSACIKTIYENELECKVQLAPAPSSWAPP